MLTWVWVIYLIVVLVPIAVGGGRRSAEDSERTRRVEITVCQQVPIGGNSCRER
jgi:hypothetical protein